MLSAAPACRVSYVEPMSLPASPPATRVPSWSHLRTLGVGRFLAMAVALIWLAAPWAADQVDDLYISLGYAHNWAESGALVWGTGERVEGYSNFLLVALCAVGAKAGLDISALAVFLSRAATLAVLWAFHRALPRDSGGDAVAVGLVLWAALARWSGLGMETPLYALLLMAGWAGVLRGGRTFGAGLWLLLLAALTRPEGAAMLVAGAALPILRLVPALTRQAIVLSVLASVAFLAYHLARVSWYGAFWPTPYLVKVAAHGMAGRGLHQLALDLLLAAPVLAGVAALGVPAGVRRWLALLPLIVQGGLLVRADGDWFGWSRLVLPGVLASSYAWLVLSERVRRSGAWVAALTTAAVGCGLFQVENTDGIHLTLRPIQALARPDLAMSRGRVTPQSQDIEWMVRHLSDGDRVIAGDVGMIGNVSHAAVEDKNGLTDRTVARFLVNKDPELLAELLARYDAPTPARFLRLEDYRREGPPVLDAYLSERYPSYDEVPFGSGVVRWYRPRSRLEVAPPDRALVLARWADLAARYPSHPWLAWHLALALADVGRLDEAEAALVEARERAPHHPLFQEGPPGLDFPMGPIPLEYVPGRGFALTRSGSLVSRPLSSEDLTDLRLALDVDAPGADGALARLTWLAPCSGELVVNVRAATILAAPTSTCAGSADARLEVAFLNDRWEEGADRNLYVALVLP